MELPPEHPHPGLWFRVAFWTLTSGSAGLRESKGTRPAPQLQRRRMVLPPVSEKKFTEGSPAGLRICVTGAGARLAKSTFCGLFFSMRFPLGALQELFSASDGMKTGTLQQQFVAASPHTALTHALRELHLPTYRLCRPLISRACNPPAMHSAHTAQPF